MRQLYLKAPGQLCLRDVASPKPGSGELVIAVRGATTCGTDLKTFKRGHPKFPMPTPMGHEFSGVVSALGDGVDKWKVGDEVMCAPTAPCRDCELCRRGLQNLCASCMDRLILGAFAEKVLVPAHVVEQNLYPKPKDLDFFEASLMEPLACAVYGLQQLPPLTGKTVAIIGAGPIGLLYQMLAIKQQPSSLIVLGRRTIRLQAAEQIGAHDVVDVDVEKDLVSAVLERSYGRGVDVVVECTGQPDVWRQAILATAQGGTTLLYGGCKAGSQVSLPLWRVWEYRLTVRGVFHFTPGAVAQAYLYLDQEDLPLDLLLSAIRPLSDYQAIFQDLSDGKAIKYGIDPAR